MATLEEVQLEIRQADPRSGLLIYDGRMRPLAFRPPAEGGGAVLIVLGDPQLGVEPSIRPTASRPLGRSDAPTRSPSGDARAPVGALGPTPEAAEQPDSTGAPTAAPIGD